MAKQRNIKKQKLDDWKGWLEEFHNESDRATAVLGGAFADARLEELLKKFFIEDKEEVEKLMSPEQALGGFGSRARVAYCLGLITKNQYKDLQIIGKIRNQFAHGLHGESFDNSRIKDLCGNLITPNKIGMDLSNTNSRSLFTVAVALLCNWIALNELGIFDDKRKAREEPELSE